VESFFLRSEVLHLSVVADVSGLAAVGTRWSPHGHCFVGPDETYEAPSGLNSWPVILSLPTVRIRPRFSCFCFAAVYLLALLYFACALIHPSQDSPPKEHWPSVVSIIMDNPQYFVRTKDPLMFAEKHLQVTYFISQIEPHLYLVVILPKDKRKQEVAVKTFVDNVARQLRNETLFARLLKPT
jgi:hypothetical protein